MKPSHGLDPLVGDLEPTLHLLLLVQPVTGLEEEKLGEENVAFLAGVGSAESLEEAR